MKAKKKIILIHEADPRHRPFDFAKAGAHASPELQETLGNHESLPWQRRDYLRECMLDKLLALAGFPKNWDHQGAGTTSAS